MPDDDRISRLLNALSGELSQEKLERLSREFNALPQDRADTLRFFVLQHDIPTDIVGRLGLADVAEFGLRWQDCEEFLRRLGYRAKVIVSTE